MGTNLLQRICPNYDIHLQKLPVMGALHDHMAMKSFPPVSTAIRVPDSAQKSCLACATEPLLILTS